MSFEAPLVITEHMHKYWKPGQETYIKVEKTSPVFPALVEWFDDHKDFTVDVGPFIGVKPYAYVESEENEEQVEFLFLYDKTDNTKLEKHHLEI